ncbi:MAG: hypothetical protein IAF02_19870 [Anaerolineae bacterium]|nr:hypothetical protein [Anaerolineae bacterium]
MPAHILGMMDENGRCTPTATCLETGKRGVARSGDRPQQLIKDRTTAGEDARIKLHRLYPTINVC